MTEDFEAATAIVLAAMLNTSIRRVFPNIEARNRDAIFLSILDCMARKHGFAVKLNGVADDDYEL